MTLTFRDDVRGPAFLELLLTMTSRARTAGLVVDYSAPSESAVALLSVLDGKLLSREESRTWPGVEVPDDAEPSTVLTFRYDQAVARALHEACPAIFGWQKRGLPCDLHLSDAEGRTVLGSSTSEGDAWVEMHMADWRRLAAGTRWLRRIRVRDDRG